MSLGESSAKGFSFHNRESSSINFHHRFQQKELRKLYVKCKYSWGYKCQTIMEMEFKSGVWHWWFYFVDRYLFVTNLYHVIVAKHEQQTSQVLKKKISVEIVYILFFWLGPFDLTDYVICRVRVRIKLTIIQDENHQEGQACMDQVVSPVQGARACWWWAQISGLGKR